MTTRLALIAIAALLSAYAVMAQGGTWNQNAHYALIRALYDGTPTIDKTRFEVGTGTGDVSPIKGHYYAAKSPGLAFEALPAYAVLRVTGGAAPAADDTQQIWYLTLWGVLLPAAVLLLLVHRVAESLEPGFGAAAAVTVGLATMALPFSTLFFSHILSAALIFGAFVVLWSERQAPPRLPLVFAAGVVAGLAVTAEFPVAVLGAVLGVYALARPRLASRATAYAVGAIVGALPALLYNEWAFGTPFKFSYYNVQVFPGANKAGLYGYTFPSFHVAVELLFANIGLLTLTPVVLLAAVGLVLLYRRGHRPEAVVMGGATLCYFVLNSARPGTGSFAFAVGGDTPGPRYLVPVLPFVAVGLASAYRKFPLTTLSLAAGSAVQMVVLTLTHPTEATWGSWYHRFAVGDFSRTALSFVGAQNIGLGLFFAAIAVAALLAARATPRPQLSLREAATGALALLGWLLIVGRAPDLMERNALGNGACAAVLLALSVALVAVLTPHLLASWRPTVHPRRDRSVSL